MTPELQSQYHLAILAPEITLALFAMAILIVGAFFPGLGQKRTLPLLALAGTLVSAASVVGLWNKTVFFGPRDSAIYAVDNFSLFFKIIFLLGLGVTVLISSRFLNARSGDRHAVAGEYYALLMLSTIGMMMVASAQDLLVVFLGIETMSIALYVLAGFARARLMSNEAALKYFLLGAFATGFLLYGIALTYSAASSTMLTKIADTLSSGGLTADRFLMLRAGLALILIGLGFKAALVPFHQWTPDVYEGSPTPVTAFMAVGAKAAAFAALLRVVPGAFGAPELSAQWHGIVLVMAVLTMTVGNVVALAQNSLKRMLAYSSIAHAGYVLIAVVATGSAMRSSQPDAASSAVNATASALFYLLVYAVMNLGAFAVLVYLENLRDTGRDPLDDSEDANLTMSDLQGLAARQPFAAAALTLFMLSLAGIPPTAGFFGKLFIFMETAHQGLYGLLIVAVLNTVISVYYYLRPVVAMYMQDDKVAFIAVSLDGAATTAPRSSAASIAVGLAILLCSVAVLSMFLLQGPIFQWAKDAATLLPAR